MPQDRARDAHRVINSDLAKMMGLNLDEVTMEKYQGKYMPEMETSAESTKEYLDARAAQEDKDK